LKLLCALPSDKRPRWIFLENVPGFLQSRARIFLHEHLRTAGYPTWSEFVLSPADLGIPNQRTRYYIMTEFGSRRFDNHHSTCCEELSPFLVTECFDAMQSKKRKRETTPLRRNLASFVDRSLHQQSPRWSQFVLSNEILSKDWARELPIVRLSNDDNDDDEGSTRTTYCFTAGYARQLHKSTGSILYVPKERSKDQKEQRISDSSMVERYSNQLRRFSPEELIGLFGFPSSFAFPATTGLEHRYRLVGNSINLFVVSALLKELLGGEA
jgi:tRNA (cytosine38-C5)-methyltransferase